MSEAAEGAGCGQCSRQPRGDTEEITESGGRNVAPPVKTRRLKSQTALPGRQEEKEGENVARRNSERSLQDEPAKERKA